MTVIEWVDEEEDIKSITRIALHLTKHNIIKTFQAQCTIQ